MHYPTQWYPGTYGPSGSCGCEQCSCGGGQYVAFVPVVYAPSAGYGNNPPVTVPQELTVDAASSPRDALVGGRSDVHLTLESIVETGAPAPQVKVTVTSDGSTSTWTDTAIPPGYHVKDGFLTVKPGAKVTIEVADALARLRWCETICC